MSLSLSLSLSLCFIHTYIYIYIYTNTHIHTYIHTSVGLASFFNLQTSAPTVTLGVSSTVSWDGASRAVFCVGSFDFA